ncbi:MAG: 3-oxoacyl-ACP reductase FabG, partial [Phycisphaerae bacterium]|nr:3-oxoacyl-ACP reductase FabG [Phycisphaerae bacterium]NIX30172.1 SDR family NAD(P)-dependent oxidoreductase [Phycisphaerae bacterium]
MWLGSTKYWRFRLSVIDLTGKVAIITGSSRGIGAAIAIELAKLGAKVVINHRNSAERAQAVLETVSHARGEGLVVQADVSVAEEAQHLVKTTLDTYGQVDILVNNAGTTRDNLIMRMKEEEWELVLKTNLTSAYHCAKAVIRPMMKRRQGRIINISSVVGLTGQEGQTNYAASKAGLIGFSKSLAREIGSRNITVNVVAPGFVPTALTEVLP